MDLRRPCAIESVTRVGEVRSQQRRDISGADDSRQLPEQHQ